MTILVCKKMKPEINYCCHSRATVIPAKAGIHSELISIIIYEEIFMLQYYVYLLASGKYGTLYTGVTNDLIKRVYEHKENLGKLI